MKGKIILMITVLFASSFAFAQSYIGFKNERNQVIENTKFRIGPFRIYPLFLFRDIGYDNNVYGEREEDNPVADYTATVSPRLRASLLFRNFFILSITENPEYLYFFKEKRERRWNNILSVDVKMLLFNSFVLAGRYADSDRRYRATRELDVRANIRIKEYGGSFFYETARLTSFGLSSVVRKISYEDISLPGEEIDLSRRLNREERSGNLEFYYRIFADSYFFLIGGYTEYRFDYWESSWRDSYSLQGYSGIRFPLLGRIRGTLALGYKKLMPKKEGKKGYSGLVANTRLDMRIRRFRLRAVYSRDCVFSIWTNSVFFLEDRYGAGISFYPIRFFRLDYDFAYAMGHYPESVLIRQPDETYMEIKRRDHYRIHTAGFAFRIIRNTGLGVRFTYWERESNIAWAGRNRWFVGGYVTYEF